MIHAVTFRIHYDDTYDQRYDTTIAAITGAAEGVKSWWGEPTSFYLVRSSKSPVELADHVIANSKFSASKDLILVVNTSGKQGHALRGHYEDKDVLTLLGERSK